MAVAIEASKIKFKIFPIPKYRKIKNIVIVDAVIIPLRFRAKIVVKVKNKVIKTIINIAGIAPKESGSTK